MDRMECGKAVMWSIILFYFEIGAQNPIRCRFSIARIHAFDAFPIQSAVYDMQ